VALQAVPGGGGDGELGRMPLMEHLTELRDRVIKCVIAIAIGAAIGFALYEHIFDFLINPYRDLCDDDPGRSITNCALLATDPLEGFSTRLKVSTYGGVALVLPVLLWQIWRFVSPGLYSKEKKYAIPFIGSAVVLFVLGAGIAYWTMPKAIDFLVSIGGGEDNIVTAYSPSKYFQLIVFMMLSFGIGFEFPVLLVGLELVGVVSPEALARVRRYAIVGIAVLVAVITPSGDPISMLALTVPMVVFYEAAIIIGKVTRRRKKQAAAADSTA
jgi:sec-independent protein translocase protein TatC